MSSDRYRELRGMLEDLIAVTPETPERAAAARYLATHCASCGVPLVGSRRGDADVCELCDPLSYVSQLQVSNGNLAAPAGSLLLWPLKVRATVAAQWNKPAVRQLLVKLAELGIELPLLEPDGRTAAIRRRRALYEAPGALNCIAQAARDGVGVRALAALLFGGVPGGLSDEIGRQIDAFDPAARIRQGA